MLSMAENRNQHGADHAWSVDGIRACQHGDDVASIEERKRQCQNAHAHYACADAGNAFASQNVLCKNGGGVDEACIDGGEQRRDNRKGKNDAERARDGISEHVQQNACAALPRFGLANASQRAYKVRP